MFSPLLDSVDPETYTLKDDTQVIIRPICPDDADDLQSTFLQLSAQSVYLRFLSFKKELSEKEARRLANVDHTTQMALVAICKENDRDTLVGLADYAILDKDHPEIAEGAVVVRDEYQGRGLGKLLLWCLVDFARLKGIRQIRSHLQVGNDRMLTMLQKSGLPYQKRFIDGVWELTVDIGLPDKQP